MKTLLTVFILISGTTGWAQNIIIGDSVTGGVSIPFTDTILSSLYYEAGPCIEWPEHYFIDFNQDSTYDISAYLTCYEGGQGSKARIEFQSYGDFHMLVDTSFTTTFQEYDYENDSLITWVGQYIIPKAYYEGDTILSNQVSSQDPKNIVAIEEGYDPPCQYIYFDDYIGDTLYIAFRRDNGDPSSFYYIKVHILSMHYIHLISAMTTDATVGLSEIPSRPTKVLSIQYFDLTGRQIPKPKKGFCIERKVTDKGIIIKKYFIQ